MLDIIWKTESIYVDVETGEIIDKKRILNKEYIKTKTTKYYETNGNIKSKKITNECRKSRQQRIFGDH
jgi:phage antirepressor YoqD-like protein